MERASYNSSASLSSHRLYFYNFSITMVCAFLYSWSSCLILVSMDSNLYSSSFNGVRQLIIVSLQYHVPPSFVSYLQRPLACYSCGLSKSACQIQLLTPSILIPFISAHLWKTLYVSCLILHFSLLYPNRQSMRAFFRCMTAWPCLYCDFYQNLQEG